jgi:hypothetical protein
MTIHYFDSHGCRISFIAREDNMVVALKKRKFVYVLPEVVEVIDRVANRCGKEVALENVSCELCVHPAIIRSIFTYLKCTGLLGKEEHLPEDEIERNYSLPNLRKGWAGNIYPILRSVKEEDYGKNVKRKEKENNF